MSKRLYAQAVGLCLAAGMVITGPAQAEPRTAYLEEVNHLIGTLVEGQPAAAKSDLTALAIMPEGTRHAGTSLDKDGTITARLEMDPALLEAGLDPVFADSAAKHFVYTIEELGRPFAFRVLVRPEGSEGEFLPLDAYVPDHGTTVTKEQMTGAAAPMNDTEKDALTPQFGQGQPVGFLSGKSVFLSPGHGWNWSSTLGRWATQRGNTHQLVEDLSNGESVLNWLQQYLWNAGAGVYTARERGFNTNMAIVEQDGAGYSQTGSWTTISTGSTHSGAIRTAPVSATETATATFTPDIPEAGRYAVYAWYRRHPDGSASTSTATRFTINHAGGQTEWIQNQDRDGFTWKYIGHYYFEPGSNPGSGSVTVSNQGSESGRNVIVDSFRFGGGMGDYPEGPSNVTSGKPRWEESGKYYSGFVGFTYNNSTVNAMPRWANWENESWQDSVYVSWHTNAFNGSVRGTETYAYSSGGFGGSFNGVPGSDVLRNRIQDQLISDIRALWDSNWTNRGSRTANFGELNPSNIPSMPSALTEIAFHDNAQDAAALRDPRFRQIAARAVYKGIVRYYAGRDGQTPVFLPEPPTQLRARATPSGIEIGWQAPPFSTGTGPLGHAATGYRVYASEHPKAFADGIPTGDTSFTLSEGLEEGRTYYLRVTATNTGGESFPTETLAVRYAGAGNNPVLIVNGFHRLDESMMIRVADPFSSNQQAREILGRMNSFDYVTEAARTVGAFGLYFDSASRRAIAEDAIALGGYETIIWLGGLENQEFNSITPASQSNLQDFLNAGGNLFISGSELSTHLDVQNGGRPFYRDFLRARYAAQNAGTRVIDPTGDGIFADLGTLTIDDGALVYNVATPDRITTEGGSVANLGYTGGGGGTAGVQYAGDFRVVTLAFPWEAIADPNQRQLVMDNVLQFFGYTGGSGVVADIVIESRDQGGSLTPAPLYQEFGAWSDSVAKSNAPGLTGDGSRFISTATPPQASARVTPDIPAEGIYEVYATWNTSSNATNVLYEVNHADGSAGVFRDQEPSNTPGGGNHDQWISLGQYRFLPGQDPDNGSLTVDVSTVTGTVTGFNTGRVYTDGFKWVMIENLEPPPTEVQDWWALY